MINENNLFNIIIIILLLLLLLLMMKMILLLLIIVLFHLSSSSSTSSSSSSSTTTTISKSKTSIAFCFLITKDLIKENIWKYWFEKLTIDYHIYVHVNTKLHNIQSLWLKDYIIPSLYIKDTKWGYLGDGIISLFEYAYINNNQWYILLSETHVPFISPSNFVIQYNKYQYNSLIEWRHSLDISIPTWDAIDRCNFHYFPREYWLHHEMWLILTHEDINDIIKLRHNTSNSIVYNTLVSGKIADECLIGVLLLITNNMKNVLNVTTTILEWQHNGDTNHPYVFTSYDENNKKLLNKKKEIYKDALFLRKISNDFPDETLKKFIT